MQNIPRVVFVPKISPNYLAISIQYWNVINKWIVIAQV